MKEKINNKVSSDKKGADNQWLKGFIEGKTRHTTLSYSVWMSMNRRCKVDGDMQQLHKTYVGCSVSKEFKDFQSFADWYVNQIGYALPKYQLDKDILKPGNKIYSKDTCVIIPQALNKFLTFRNGQRGQYPLGVHKAVYRPLYKSSLSIDGNCVSLGTYPTIELAQTAYKSAKEAEAQRWYRRLLAGEFLVDERVITIMKNWKLEESYGKSE